MGAGPARASWVVSGSTVLVPARVAAVLVDRLDVDGLRVEVEEEGDREACEVLASLTAVARVWAAEESFPLPGRLPEVAAELPSPEKACVRPADPAGSVPMPPTGWIRAKDAAAASGVPGRTVRHRAERGLVAAVKVRGAWWVDPEGLAG